MTYHIDRCQRGQVPDVMAFIDAFYRPGHLLATNRALFDWQYEHRDGTYNLAIATDQASSNILGILGFIDSARYDDALSADNCLWLALWQVRPGIGIPTLGPALLTFVQRSVEHTVLAVSGVRDASLQLYRAMGFVVTAFRHYYMTNPDVEEQRIAVIPIPTPRVTAASDTAVELQTLTADRLMPEAAGIPPIERVPPKSATYFWNRYLQHPFYTYDVHVIRRQGAPVGLMATRVATHDGSSALRIVDLLAEPSDVPDLGPSLVGLARRTGCEYVNLLEHGVEDACLRRAGFVEVDPLAGVVVPNHFEPLERQNRRVTLCYRRRHEDRDPRFLAFRADGDQDRPNQL